jgi:uncharacterized linocin/CFP29 family protein
MSHLLREHAPVSELNWNQIDTEARERLAPGLAARRLVDFVGPLGWQHSATNLGRVTPVGFAAAAGSARLEPRSRVVLPLAELHADFSVSRSELRAGDRGAEDVDFDDLDAAAEVVATAENIAVFHGWAEAGIDGITTQTPHGVIKAGKAIEDYPIKVAQAVELLLRSGVDGPYGIALGRDEYTRVIQTTEHGGYLLAEHLKRILEGPLVWAPGVKGAVVVSLRGGDFLFESGQDLSVGYATHDAENVNLYIEESFSFRVATPEAAVAIA